jgi:hypothetical protein
MNHKTTRLILESEDENDMEKIKVLAHDLGVKIISEEHPENLKSKEYYEEIVAKGGNMSYVEDPVSWQKEIREDRF